MLHGTLSEALRNISHQLRGSTPDCHPCGALRGFSLALPRDLNAPSWETGSEDRATELSLPTVLGPAPRVTLPCPTASSLDLAKLFPFAAQGMSSFSARTPVKAPAFFSLMGGLRGRGKPPRGRRAHPSRPLLSLSSGNKGKKALLILNTRIDCHPLSPHGGSLKGERSRARGREPRRPHEGRVPLPEAALLIEK